jgi:hypothetical protein
MKYITVLRNIFLQKQPKVLLGRWNIVYCQEKINKKVELSNEDHCGTCNNYKYNNYKYNNYKEINFTELIFYENM